MLSIIKSMFSKQAPVDYQKLIREGAVIVDVRNPGEFKAGHFRGSKNYPLPSFSNYLVHLKGKKVIVVCRSGMRSGQAKSILEQNGIEVYNAGSWKNLK